MEYKSGNIFIREEGPMAAGAVVEGHEHNFDHTTYVTKGSFLIERLEGNKVVQSVTKRAGDLKNWVLILAGACHRLTSLEDGSVYHCIYSHRTPQGEITQEYDGWPNAYG